MEEKEILNWIRESCARFGRDDNFAEEFFSELKEDEEICKELVYYIQQGTFACKAKVEGYTVVDIMVWQMDHFKAWLDRDNSEMKQSGDGMVLMAFRTLLAVRKNPEQYIQKMQYETGTDYPDKY